MSKESLSVRFEVEHLRSENEDLKLKRSQEFDRLHAEVEHLKKENDKLHSENRKLGQRYDTILKQLEKCNKKLEEKNIDPKATPTINEPQDTLHHGLARVHDGVDELTKSIRKN
jgi:predicted nuclease with TOPRIM domain